MAFPALLDTCVLYPAYLCDTMLRLAEAEAYRPLWSIDIFIELRRNIVEAGIPSDRVDRRIAHMRHSFPDAMVTGYESLIDGYDQRPEGPPYPCRSGSRQRRSHRHLQRPRLPWPPTSPTSPRIRGDGSHPLLDATGMQVGHYTGLHVCVVLR
ncbi:hypothetical protein [Candidatus Protofrankia californiensis]|uniref:hypothetical protein n=1 Tax=Candidatus Protofrankia californiensis TaxID=1839754 RepID=UPI0019D1C4DD|nr:hypothetical protein [Candidatus Protofrankia californiensis]